MRISDKHMTVLIRRHVTRCLAVYKLETLKFFTTVMSSRRYLLTPELCGVRVDTKTVIDTGTTVAVECKGNNMRAVKNVIDLECLHWISDINLEKAGVCAETLENDKCISSLCLPKEQTVELQYFTTKLVSIIFTIPEVLEIPEI